MALTEKISLPVSGIFYKGNTAHNNPTINISIIASESDCLDGTYYHLTNNVPPSYVKTLTYRIGQYCLSVTISGLSTSYCLKSAIIYETKPRGN